MNKNILVAGGAGYIGSHVCWRLHHAGYTPIVLDNLSAGHEWAVRWGDLVRGDIGDEDLVLEICQKYNPAALMNFAALTDVAWSVREPEVFFENNAERAQKLFCAAYKGGVRHIVFSSTAAVYGVPDRDGTVTEEAALRPSNPYGESKIKAEQALSSPLLEGMRSVTLRYFNAAGAAPVDVDLGEAHWPETNLIPRVILSALGYEGPLNLFGNDYDTPDGTAIRDYIHVCDLADAHIAALQYLLDGGATGTFNLGTGQGHSVMEVIRAVEHYLGTKINVEINPRRPGDVPVMLAKPDKAHRHLGWSARHALQDIISSAVEWHKTPQYYERVIRPNMKPHEEFTIFMGS